VQIVSWIWRDTKVSDITPDNIKFSFSKLPAGNFNSNLRLLRAVLNFGLKQGFLKTNAALSLDFIHLEKQEVTCLHPTIVEKMLRHAQQNEPELLISLIVGFWAGLRSAEIDRLQFKSVVLDDPQPHVFVPAAITKSKEPRTVPLSENAIAWLQWFFTNVRQPQPEERLMQGWTPNKLRAAQNRAIGLDAKWVHNCKRHCFASYWLALHRNLNELVLLLGHTTPAMARRHYLGAATYTDAQANFGIRP
jgi:integrase